MKRNPILWAGLIGGGTTFIVLMSLAESPLGKGLAMLPWAVAIYCSLAINGFIDVRRDKEPPDEPC